MTENIQQAKIHFDSENYEIALRFLDKELERNSYLITSEICYYKGMSLINIGIIRDEKFWIESGKQFLERLLASKLDRDFINFPNAKEKLNWAKSELKKSEQL